MLHIINYPSLTPFFIFLLIGNCFVEAGRVLIYAACSQEKYEPNMPYETNLDSLLSSVVASSSQTLYSPFAVGNGTDPPAGGAAAYGLYQCRGDLKPGDCSGCVASLIGQAALLCPYAYGASLQLDGCFLRYEETDFLGKPDSSFRYNKCGGAGAGGAGAGGGDGEFARRRDDVLADLGGGGAAAAGFRVSAAGKVGGYAQCLGDLAAEDCAACLGEAVEEVKSLCGAAAAGDVFLAQCYVRYWESGYYDDDSPDSSNRDEVGRTVAIIVGVIAGVALLIVLLSICKNTLSK